MIGSVIWFAVRKGNQLLVQRDGWNKYRGCESGFLFWSGLLRTKYRGCESGLFLERLAEDQIQWIINKIVQNKVLLSSLQQILTNFPL